MIFLDSDALIGILRADPKIIEFLFAHQDQTYAIPSPVLYEIYYGFYFPPSSKRFQKDIKFLQRLQKEEQQLMQFLNGTKCFDLSLNAIKKAAEISANLDNRGKHIGIMDALIAGIVLSNGYNELLTRNTKHFENIPELTLYKCD